MPIIQMRKSRYGEVRLFAGDYNLGPRSGSFQSLCLTPLRMAHRPLSPVGCGSAPARERPTAEAASRSAPPPPWQPWAPLRASPASRSRWAPGAPGRLPAPTAGLPGLPVTGPPSCGRAVHSGGWYPGSGSSQAASSVHSPSRGGPGPVAHAPEEESDGPAPIPSALGAHPPQPTRPQGPDPTAHEPVGVPDYPPRCLMTLGLPCVTPLTQGQPGEPPPLHLGHPWLRPRPHSRGVCPANPGWAWSSGAQEPGNGPPRRARRGVLGCSRVGVRAVPGPGSAQSPCAPPPPPTAHSGSHEPLDDSRFLAPETPGDPRPSLSRTRPHQAWMVGVRPRDPQCSF